MMASRALARVATFGRRLSHGLWPASSRQTRDKVVLHWLGDMFDPQLAGYWGCARFRHGALETVLRHHRRQQGKVEGIKISLLDNAKEVAAAQAAAGRRALLHRRRFQLCRTDRRRRRTLQPCAARHLRRCRALGVQGAGALPSTTTQAFRATIEPTVPLSRKIFEAPTQYYKAGVVSSPGSTATRTISPCRRHAVGPRHRPLCGYLPAGRSGQRAGQARAGRGTHAVVAGGLRRGLGLAAQVSARRALGRCRATSHMVVSRARAAAKEGKRCAMSGRTSPTSPGARPARPCISSPRSSASTGSRAPLG